MPAPLVPWRPSGDARGSRPCGGDRTSVVNAASSGAEYWDARYKGDLSEPYEWILRYEDIRNLVEEVTGGNRACRVLHVGCGNSLVPERLYDDGFRNIVNVDASAVVIAQMLARNADRPEMQWIQMDLTAMSLEDEGYDVVLDKSTLDALAISNFDRLASARESETLVAAYLLEVGRVLRQGGSFLCISLGGPRDRLQHFEKSGVMPSVRHVELPSSEPPRPFTRPSAHHAYIYCKGTAEGGR